jgi:hypothetical protein
MGEDKNMIVSPPEGFIEFIHNVGHNSCDKVAFFYNKEELSSYAVMRSSEVRLVDGTEPLPGSRLQCGSCGMELNFVGSDGSCGVLE